MGVPAHGVAMEQSLGAVVLAVALVVAATPVAQAGPPDCQAVTDEDALETGGHHVQVDDGSNEARVWEETNGVDGLQTSACQTANGRTVDADAHVATVPPADLPTAGDVVDLLNETCNDLFGPYYCP